MREWENKNKNKTVKKKKKSTCIIFSQKVCKMQNLLNRTLIFSQKQYYLITKTYIWELIYNNFLRNI